MIGKKKSTMQVLLWILRTFLVATVIFFIWGELTMPVETAMEESKYTVFQANWEQVFADGSRQPVEIPGQCDNVKGEMVAIETTLSGLSDNTWFCIRVSQQELNVYVGDELREAYSTLDTDLFGKTSAITYVFFRIDAADMGKVLRLETISDSAYSGYYDEIIIGEKQELWQHLFRMYFPSILAAVIMLLVGLVAFAICLCYRVYSGRYLDIAYLAVGVCMASMWLIMESRLRQFFIPNISIATNMGFFMIMLIPYPFLVYCNVIQRRRYEKIYMLLAFLTIGNTVLATVLQVLNIKDFFETMGISHVILVLLFIAMIGTILADCKRGYVKEYQPVAIGFVAIILGGVFEIYQTYVNSARYNGVGLSISLAFLLFMAAMKNCQDIMKIHQEKQNALIANESKAIFVANMSHEIRTPINTIIGMNQIIMRENEDDAIAGYAKNIDSASHMLLSLINDVLDFSKMEAGKLEIINQPYKLAQAVRDIYNGMEMKALDKGLTFTVDVDENMPSELKGDEIRIKQIINNLVSNAIKYTEKGSVAVTVKPVKKSGNFCLQVAVKDTGIGIREEDIDRLFDSFQRLELKKNRYIEGTGLGLSITQQLVEVMGGTITVDSTHGKGSCFTVTLPQEIVDGTAVGKFNLVAGNETGAPKELEVTLHAPEASVLVVDDNAMNLKVIEALLKPTEIKLDLASGGEECLAMCREKKYDLIMMDHMMPEPDGIETLHLLRADETSLNQNTTTIVLTANVISGAKELYEKEGFADYVTKPVMYQRLEEVLKMHLFFGKKKADKTEKVETVETVEKVETIPVIDKALALSYCADDEALYQEIVEMYIEQGPEYTEQLQKSFAEGSWKEYRTAAHTIKNTSLNVGATAFSEMAKQHEFAARDEDVAFLKENFDTFMEQYQNLINYLKDNK